MTDSIIPEAAVEAAKEAFWAATNDKFRAAIAAALPHITNPRLAAAQARIAELEEALRQLIDLHDLPWSIREHCVHRAREVLERKP